MSTISDALKRAQVERNRLRPPNPHEPADDIAPESPHGPGLASVILRQAKPAKPESTPSTPTSLIPNIPAAPTAMTAPPPAPTPLADAIRQAPVETPAAVKHEQKRAETIIEDYSSKRRLNLPAAIVAYHDRSGPIAEQYRKMRDNLMATSRQTQALVISSSRPGEGKTVTTLNLALSLAEIRAHRILIIDASLHGGSSRRTLSGLLHEHAAAGLAELLAGTSAELASIEPFLKPTPWHNLYLLPAGARSTPQAAAELLQSQNLRTLLRRARASFDWIFLDAPAALHLPDAGLLATAADGILLTLAMHRTPQSQFQKTVRRLQSMNIPVKSTILTRA